MYSLIHREVFVPSAPMDTSLTPLLAMKSRALFTLEILWTLIFPLSGLAKRSPTEKDSLNIQDHNITSHTTSHSPRETKTGTQLLLLHAFS